MTYGWVNFLFPSPVTINSGSFYLVMIQGGNAPDAAGIAVDETAPQLRSWAKFETGSGPWIPAGGNFLMKDRQLLTLDEAEIAARANELAARAWRRYESSF
jgi:hypothetical protein